MKTSGSYSTVEVEYLSYIYAMWFCSVWCFCCSVIVISDCCIYHLKAFQCRIHWLLNFRSICHRSCCRHSCLCYW